jgi:Spy/CpxP family protein refolding chaperone
MKTRVITFAQTRRLFMKRNALVGVLMTMIVAGGSEAVLAGHTPGAWFGDFPPGMEIGNGAFEERMAKILKLTETQKAQIKDIFDTERRKIKPLFEKMVENRKLLMQAADANVFDEAAVRTIAVGQAQVEAELIISSTRVHNRINAILTPEQRELEKNLRPDMHIPPMPMSN